MRTNTRYPMRAHARTRYDQSVPTPDASVVSRIHDAACGWLEDEEHRAWFGLLTVHARAVKAVDQDLLRAHGLSFTAFELLFRLATAGPDGLRPSELTRVMTITHPQISRLLTDLAVQGLVERVPHASDGRGTTATLTLEGWRLLETAHETHLQTVRDVFLRGLTADQVKVIADALAPAPARG